MPFPDDPRPATVAVVLAGGRSRRMGVPKAGVLLEGRPLLAHVAASARAAGLRPVVVAKRDSVLPVLADVERWDEPDRPTHPLTGVAAALRRADEPVVVVPVDLPWVPAGLLGHLARATDHLAVVEGAGRLHPLLGRFTPACADDLRAAAEEGAPVVSAVRALGATTVGGDALASFGDPGRFLANVNRPEDLAEKDR